jgi:copper chaperone
MESTLIKVGGMMCDGCVKNITGILGGLAGVTSAQVSLEQGEATVTFDPAAVTRQALCAAIEDAGFDAR